MELLHIGVPTEEVRQGETYMEGMKVYVTDPESSPYKFEYLRFDSDSWMPEEIQKMVHVAIKVDSLKETLKDMDKVLVGETIVDEHMTIAFGLKDGAVLELVETK